MIRLHPPTPTTIPSTGSLCLQHHVIMLLFSTFYGICVRSKKGGTETRATNENSVIRNNVADVTYLMYQEEITGWWLLLTNSNNKSQ